MTKAFPIFTRAIRHAILEDLHAVFGQEIGPCKDGQRQAIYELVLEDIYAGIIIQPLVGLERSLFEQQ